MYSLEAWEAGIKGEKRREEETVILKRKELLDEGQKFQA